jgi:hypothetical protein
MLRHKALIQCARYAFGFSGIIEQDEAERIIDISHGSNMTKSSKDLKDTILDELNSREEKDLKDTILDELNSREENETRL